MDKKKYSISMNKKEGCKGSRNVMGSTDMGIPAFKQKPKNLEKLSAISTDRKKVMGKDKYS